MSTALRTACILGLGAAVGAAVGRRHARRARDAWARAAGPRAIDELEVEIILIEELDQAFEAIDRELRALSARPPRGAS